MRFRIWVAAILVLAGSVLSIVLVRSGVQQQKLPLIPWPEKVERLRGTFLLGPETRIITDAASRPAGEYLAQCLWKLTGYRLPVIESPTNAATNGNILLTISSGAPAQFPEVSREQELPGGLNSAAGERYELLVRSDGMVINGKAEPGVFYGVQTLLQLLPLNSLGTRTSSDVSTNSCRLPCVRIQDQPRFLWRGLMLDVSRHFFNRPEIEQLLDAMALHKLNVFHWHLTDDQGWRIQIKKYPRLTEIGAWRSGIGFGLDPKSSTAYGPDARYGGFYTQEDIREIVAYAQARHITVVPEIELPGHASAALAAYPELSCSGGPYSTDLHSNRFAGVFCAGNKETFTFLEDALAEVCDLFPSKYIHIGGDEVPTENWRGCPRCQAAMRREGFKDARQLEGCFVHRIGNFLNARGRCLIGWSEIRHNGLPPQAAVMDWIGGAVEAARAGHEVVRSPETECYFDFYQARDRAAEPRATAAYLPLSRVYKFEPIPPGLEARYQKNILGAQGNIWTEHIPSLSQVEYMAFPRACALAEVLWSPASPRNWANFQRRLILHCQLLDRMGIAHHAVTAAE